MADFPLFIKESTYIKNNMIHNLIFIADIGSTYPKFEDNFFMHIDPIGAIVGVDELPISRINSTARDIYLEIDGTKSVNEIVDQVCSKMNQTKWKLSTSIKAFLNESYRRGFINLLHEPCLSKTSISGSLSWYAPRTCAIEITRSCDLKCKHCYTNAGETSGEYNASQELETKDWLAVIDQLSKGCERLSITGGDPLVHPQFKEIVSHAVKSGMHVSVLTNGMRIDESIAGWLYDIGVKTVKLSLDGSSDIIHDGLRDFRGAFDKTLDAIRILVGRGIEVSIGSVITEDSLDDISKIADLAYATGAKALSFGRILNKGRAVENKGLLLTRRLDDIIGKLDEAMRKYSKKDFMITFEEGSYWIDSFHDERPSLNQYLAYRDANLGNCMNGCGAGSYLLFISSIGQVKPCAICSTVLGELKTNKSLQEIMESRDTMEFRKLVAPAIRICSGCEHLTTCLGCVAHGVDYAKHHEQCVWKSINLENGVRLNEFIES